MSKKGKQSQNKCTPKAPFKPMKKDSTINLSDPKSAAHAHLYVRTADDEVYFCRPDKDIVENTFLQRACDYCLYAKNHPQLCFVELKGENIKEGEKENPYVQILGTIEYFRAQDNWSYFMNATVDKHAFIVSPARQRIPDGIDSKERQLKKALHARLLHGKGAENRVHYVRVLQRGKYSDDGKHIICSSNDPLRIPYIPAI